jgi:hypothetical protein
MSRKRVEHAAQRKAARQMYTDTLEVLRLGIAEDDADEFNAADRLVATKGVYAYLQLAGITQRALRRLAAEWNVGAEDALERIAPRRRRPGTRPPTSTPAE